MSTPFRYLLFLLGIIFSLPLVFVLFLLPRIPISFTFLLYLLGSFIIAIGLLSAPSSSRWSLALIITGSLLVFITVTTRILFPPSGARVSMITLPGPSAPRVQSRILDERDVVLLGAWLSPHVGFVSTTEAQSLIPAFSQSYDEMHSQGVTPLSPFLTTYLNQQSSTKFDMVIAEPKSQTTPTKAILFLHGFGGNFTVQCWLIAKAGDRIDALTVCPSTSVNAQWWDQQGQAILQETLDYLHQRGIQRIYLAGLSNGGIGASRLADSHKEEIDGLILISGADPNAVITNLPVLVIHGKSDERIPAAMMEQYAAGSGPNATYRLFEGDHFLLLKQAEQVREVIAKWLLEQEKNAHNP